MQQHANDSKGSSTSNDVGKAQGLSDSKAIELINFITDTNVPNGTEKKETPETKE